MYRVHTLRASVLSALLAVTLLTTTSAVHAQSAAITVEPTATFDAQSGSATVTGTYACGDSSGFTFIEVVVRQSVGRVSTVTGSAFAEVAECIPGATGTWAAEVFPSNGEFRGGKATASAQLLVNGVGQAETGQVVGIRG